MADQSGFESWALVELMGHQRIIGKVTEQEIAGGKLFFDSPEMFRKAS